MVNPEKLTLKDGKAPGERIAKRLARAGLCSRREAERWIADGRVKVNGTVLTSPAFNVTAKARITVDDQPLKQAEPVAVWRYHKPKGLVTSHKDEQGRETVFERLPADIGRVISVGRLDLNTEGLLLVTNDGGLARHLELPSTGWKRRYRVRVHGRVKDEDLKGMQKGITVDGIKYGAIEANVDSQKGSNTWLSMTLTEGKNREIRKVLEHMDLQVARLIRISYGPFQLGDLPRGEVKQIPRRVLRDQLGTKAPEFDLGETPATKPAKPERPHAHRRRNPSR